MSVAPERLTIVTYPDPVLRRKAEAVPKVTDEVRAVAARMIDLMREARGIGLAAPQVGLSWRMFVAEVFPDDEDEPEGDGTDGDRLRWTDGPVVYINPVISEPHGPVEGGEEGCLSLPEIAGRIMRPPRVTMTATDLEGRRFTQRGAGLLARCWQHEVDHLDGVLILDRMDQMSRLKMRSTVRALEKRG